MGIHFFTEKVKNPVKKKSELIKWIKMSILEEEKIPGNINFIFCDDEYLLKLNRKKLGHDYYTDIITFDLSENKNEISGDIYISVDSARNNSKEYNQSFTDEISRLMIHGVLHLIGYNDKNGKGKKLMTDKENLYLTKK